MAWDWEARVRARLATGDIVIHLQPIVELPIDDKPVIKKFEALARFPELTQVNDETVAALVDEACVGFAPDVWFGVAGQFGLQVDLELLALERALETLNTLAVEYAVSVNLSPGTLSDPRTRGIIGRYAPERVVVELTEHIVIADYDELRKALRHLQSDVSSVGTDVARTHARRGFIRYAIDDIGSGVSSMRHLIELASIIDYAKLDRSLTVDINYDAVRQAATRGVVKMGRTRDLRSNFDVIAEGIETRAQLRTVSELGCAGAQGWYFGRPMPLDEITRANLGVPLTQHDHDAEDNDDGSVRTQGA